MRVAIIGTAARSDYLYGPIVKALPELELVAVWGRSEGSARALGESLQVPHFTDLQQLIDHTAPQIGIVSVAYGANGEVGLMVVEHGLSVLLETPIAHDLEEADRIIEAAQRKGVKVEVAEQFHRRPLEQIKLKLIELGIFGRVHTSFNDFAGHGYHGVSVMRSYLGFDARPLTVTGMVRKFGLDAHWSLLSGSRGLRTETQEHGMVEFEGGRIGIYHWTDVGYDSALRWWRSSRFLAEKGMGITTGIGGDVDERLSVLTHDREAPHFITLERRLERNDGGALRQIVAHTPLPEHPTVVWENPFKSVKKGHGVQWHDDEIGVASCLMSLVNAVSSGTEPSYGPLQAKLDQEITQAIRLSSREGGIPISLPVDPQWVRRMEQG
ncbi:hypothetical protein DC3_40100 [Deinococcus cellulosilyticus NBRC 106333 = KACC 11606]|uniref:Gfo/Idh/MocA-like oxidoreductase N-terminal domain-containing protein n=2 Tax=Deinococcus cellulosilyticus TaxID=401558 RepID=A0A511N6A4_DEIC1|nr:hypothetical protein DC3_40100 [Deinococcus cellulosilyticus NBRC 106333 = KACC 11606]